MDRLADSVIDEMLICPSAELTTDWGDIPLDVADLSWALLP